MKNYFRPVAMLGLLVLAVTGGVVAQTTYDLPTGKTLTVINQLPETLSPYFDDSVLADRLGNREPAFDYRVGASISGDALQFVIMIPEYFPETPPTDIFDRPFVPNSRRLLPTAIPERYMMPLQRWYANAWDAMPDDLKRAVLDFRLDYFAIFQKENHWLMFNGERSSSGLPKVTQPIISTDPQYGEVQIWGDRSGYFSSVQRALDQGFYPLDPAVDRVTGERNTSWLVYKFFDALPEEE